MAYFLTKISNWVYFEGPYVPRTENVGIFYDLLARFLAIHYILWPLRIICGHLVDFSRFGMLGP
jgi:hypothetical protein